jgi:hypothetical protein
MSFQLNCDVCGRNMPAHNHALPCGWVRLTYEQYNFNGPHGLQLPATEICGRCFWHIEDFIKKMTDHRKAVTA